MENGLTPRHTEDGFHAKLLQPLEEVRSDQDIRHFEQVVSVNFEQCLFAVKMGELSLRNQGVLAQVIDYE